jgi:hypothetical protein
MKMMVLTILNNCNHNSNVISPFEVFYSTLASNGGSAYKYIHITYIYIYIIFRIYHSYAYYGTLYNTNTVCNLIYTSSQLYLLLTSSTIQLTLFLPPMLPISDSQWIYSIA